MAEAFVVSSEADLWALLKAAMDGAKDLPPPDVIHITGWRPTLLYFPTEPIGHSLSPSLAKAVFGFHASLARSFAYARYGQADGRRLTARDQEALDIRMLVLEGSNGLQILDRALEGLIHGLLNKMSGKQMTYLLAIFLLLYFGETATKDWLHETYASKDHALDDENALKLSQQETERMKLLQAALDKNPGLKPIVSIADEARTPLVRSAAEYDRSKILGVEITKDQARAISSKTKEKGQAKRLDGRFEVVEIDVENPEGYMGTLRDMKTQQEIRVSINKGELPDTDTQTLFEALRQKSSVDALVNAWMVGDKIAYAAIVRADPIKP